MRPSPSIERSAVFRENGRYSPACSNRCVVPLRVGLWHPKLPEEGACDGADSNRNSDPSLVRRSAHLALQSGVGILPERWIGLDSTHPDHPVAHGPTLAVYGWGVHNGKVAESYCDSIREQERR